MRLSITYSKTTTLQSALSRLMPGSPWENLPDKNPMLWTTGRMIMIKITTSRTTMMTMITTITGSMIILTVRRSMITMVTRRISVSPLVIQLTKRKSPVKKLRSQARMKRAMTTNSTWMISVMTKIFGVKKATLTTVASLPMLSTLIYMLKANRLPLTKENPKKRLSPRGKMTKKALMMPTPMTLMRDAADAELKARAVVAASLADTQLLHLTVSPVLMLRPRTRKLAAVREDAPKLLTLCQHIQSLVDTYQALSSPHMTDMHLLPVLVVTVNSAVVVAVLPLRPAEAPRRLVNNVPIPSRSSNLSSPILSVVVSREARNSAEHIDLPLMMR